LQLGEHPFAADREEVEVGEPERGGDEEPENRSRDSPSPIAVTPIPIATNASPSAMISTSP
jgi:hypothetical protein